MKITISKTVADNIINGRQTFFVYKNNQNASFQFIPELGQTIKFYIQLPGQAQTSGIITVTVAYVCPTPPTNYQIFSFKIQSFKGVIHSNVNFNI